METYDRKRTQAAMQGMKMNMQIIGEFGYWRGQWFQAVVTIGGWHFWEFLD